MLGTLIYLCFELVLDLVLTTTGKREASKTIAVASAVWREARETWQTLCVKWEAERELRRMANELYRTINATEAPRPSASARLDSGAGNRGLLDET